MAHDHFAGGTPALPGAASPLQEMSNLQIPAKPGIQTVLREFGSLPPQQAGFRLALRLAGMTATFLLKSQLTKNKRKPKLPFVELSRL